MGHDGVEVPSVGDLDDVVVSRERVAPTASGYEEVDEIGGKNNNVC